MNTKKAQPKTRRARKIRVVYVDGEGCAFNRPPAHKQSKQLTRQDVDQLAARYQVILEKVE